MSELNKEFLTKILAVVQRDSAGMDGIADDATYTFVLNDAIVILTTELGHLTIDTFAGVPIFLDVSTNILPYEEIEHPQTRIYRILKEFNNQFDITNMMDLKLGNGTIPIFESMMNEVFDILQEDFDEVD